MSKNIGHVQYDETLMGAEDRQGFWLYDTTRGMRIAMNAKSKDHAFVNALKYYQNRLAETETELNSLRKKVDSFLLEIGADYTYENGGD